MKTSLIGYTGFVGSNLDKQFKFDFRYNTRNISNIRDKKFDLVICAGVRAQKWLANQQPEKDLNEIIDLINDLKEAKIKNIILISTIDVYNNPSKVDENTIININKLHPYGKNRLYIEKWVKENYSSYLIVRLPALFGLGLKKNFIYDLINIIPSVIMPEKFIGIINKAIYEEAEIIKNSYTKDNNGNYSLNKEISNSQNIILKNILKRIGFTSLSFTDERSQFSFYYLDNLWNDIKIAIDNDIKLLNLAVEPISAKEIAFKCFNIDFKNIIESRDPLLYDMKTIHSNIYGKSNGYLYTKDEVIEQIKDYLKKRRENKK